MRFLVFVFMLFLSHVVNGKDFNNGCGSGWNERFVPDRIRLLGINFVESCSEHDNCYSRCLVGGVNYNKPICKLTSVDQLEGRRKSCDDKFQYNMNESCKEIDMIRRPICFGVSALFSIAVRKGGGDSFDGFEIPMEYFDFIESDAAKTFDFSNFANEVNQIQSIKEISESNKLKLTIQKNLPLMQVLSIDSKSLLGAARKNSYNKVNIFKYGSVDLTNASKGREKLTIKNIDMVNLNISKFDVEQ